jgi:hypothetical protein
VSSKFSRHFYRKSTLGNSSETKRKGGAMPRPLEVVTVAKERKGKEKTVKVQKTMQRKD